MGPILIAIRNIYTYKINLFSFDIKELELRGPVMKKRYTKDIIRRTMFKCMAYYCITGTRTASVPAPS